MNDSQDLHGRAMSLDAKLIARLEKALGVVDDHGTVGPRLLDDARRLWARVQRFIAMGLVPAEAVEKDSLELASYALQLPLRRGNTLTTGKPARATLRERAEEAAELLVTLSEDTLEESLLDRTARILHELPQRLPILDETKLLADAVNLEDFGVTGLVAQAVQLGRQGEGLTQAARGVEMREQYGYWEARLKEGFHFEPIRQIARQRLEIARQVAAALLSELREDGRES